MISNPINKILTTLMVKTTTQNPLTTAATKTTWTTVSAEEGGINDLGAADLVNERLNSGKIGNHLLHINIGFANFEASPSLQVYVYKNGSPFLRFDIDNAGVSTTRACVFDIPIVTTDTTDYFEIFTASTSDASYSIIGSSGADSKSFFGMSYVGA